MSQKTHKRRRQSVKLRTVPWKMSWEVFGQYTQLGEIAASAEEGSEAHGKAIEMLKSLPGYPGVCGDGIQFQPVVTRPTTVQVLH